MQWQIYTFFHPVSDIWNDQVLCGNTCARQGCYFQNVRMAAVFERSTFPYRCSLLQPEEVWLIYKSDSKSRAATLQHETVTVDRECISDACSEVVKGIQGIVPTDELTSGCQPACPCTEKNRPWRDGNPWPYLSELTSDRGERKSIVFDAVEKGQRAKKKIEIKGKIDWERHILSSSSHLQC